MVSTEVAFPKDINSRVLTISARVFKIENQGLPDQKSLLLREPILTVLEAYSGTMTMLSGEEVKIPNEKERVSLDTQIEFKIGTVTARKKAAKTIEKVRVDLQLTHSEMVPSEKDELLIRSASTRMIKYFELGKKVKVPFGTLKIGLSRSQSLMQGTKRNRDRSLLERD